MSTNKSIADWLREIAEKIENLADPENEWDPEIFDEECRDLQKIIDNDLERTFDLGGD